MEANSYALPPILSLESNEGFPELLPKTTHTSTQKTATEKKVQDSAPERLVIIEASAFMRQIRNLEKQIIKYKKTLEKADKKLTSKHSNKQIPVQIGSSDSLNIAKIIDEAKDVSQDFLKKLHSKKALLQTVTKQKNQLIEALDQQKQILLEQKNYQEADKISYFLNEHPLEPMAGSTDPIDQEKQEETQTRERSIHEKIIMAYILAQQGTLNDSITVIEGLSKKHIVPIKFKP